MPRRSRAAQKPKPPAFAIVGAGESTWENTRDLLGDLYGFTGLTADGDPVAPEGDEPPVHVIVPVGDEHLTDTVQTVLDWVDAWDGEYDAIVDNQTITHEDADEILDNASEVVEDSNIDAGLIDRLVGLRAEGHDVALIVAWGEDGDDHAEIAMDLASANDVTVLDLTKGLDRLSFKDNAEPEAAPEQEQEQEPEKEPEAEEPKPRRRGRARKEAAPKEEPLEEPEQALSGEREESVGQRLQRETKERNAKAAEEPVDETTDQDAQERAAKMLAGTTDEDEDVTTGYKMVEAPADDLAHRFGFHPATEQTKPLHEAARSLTLSYARDIAEILPVGREQALFLTKVEEALFWANAAIARSLAPLEAQEAAEEPKASRGRPRADGSPAQPRSATERAQMQIYNDETGEWEKKGRGRMPSGARWRKVDPRTGDVVDAFIQEDMTS